MKRMLREVNPVLLTQKIGVSGTNAHQIQQ